MSNGQFGSGVGNGSKHLSKAAKDIPKIGPGSMILDTYMNMKAGDDFGTAAFKGVATGMLWATAPGVMTAHMVGSLAVGGVTGGQQRHRRAKDKFGMNMHTGTVGGGYMDTNRALTMRQAAVEAIQGSKLNARSALGGEARILNSNFHR